MKYLIIFLVLIIVYLAYYLYSFYEAIELNVKIKKIYLNKMFKGNIEIVIDLLLNNSSLKTITFKDFYVEIYYLNKLIARTKKINNTIFLAPNVKDFVAVKDLNITFLLNDESLNLASKILVERGVKLEIKLKTKVLFIPLSFSTEYIYN
jgi:hypothetical protein